MVMLYRNQSTVHRSEGTKVMPNSDVDENKDKLTLAISRFFWSPSLIGITCCAGNSYGTPSSPSRVAVSLILKGCSSGSFSEFGLGGKKKSKTSAQHECGFPKYVIKILP